MTNKTDIENQTAARPATRPAYKVGAGSVVVVEVDGQRIACIKAASLQ